jgi:hypothetical protein
MLRFVAVLLTALFIAETAHSTEAGWALLPAGQWDGEPPAWPLDFRTEREGDVWVELWRKPQAAMWDQLGQALEVALFVRLLVAAEQPDAKTELIKTLRQYLDSLGLSVQGMLRNRWKIAPEVADAEPEPSNPAPPRRRSARDRLKVVAAGGA